MSQPSHCIKSTQISTNQVWTDSPACVEITVSKVLSQQLQSAMSYLSNSRAAAVELDIDEYELYANAENDTFDTTDDKGNRYVIFDPEFTVDSASLRLTSYGEMICIVKAKHTSDHFIAALGTYNALMDSILSKS